MNVARAIAKAMKAEGVDILFAYPVNPLIEAAAEEDIRTVIVRQERIGLHMADAYSRVTSGDRFGVFCMQHGPGSENAFGGVAQAFSESVPILVVPSGYPRRLAHYFPNFNSTLNMRHVTKWAEPLTMGAAIPEVMRRVFSQLRNGRPGPVLLEVPADVWNEEVPDGWAHTPDLHGEERPGPRGCRRGGAGARRAEAAGDLRRPGRPLGQGLGRAESPGRGLEHPGDHLDRGQERLPRGPPALARQRRAGQSPAGEALPRGRRRHPRRRLQLRAHRLRRRHARRQDDHPRHRSTRGT